MKLLGGLLLLLGAFASLSAILGVYRLRTPLQRIHAAGVGETLALFLLLLGIGLCWPEPRVLARLLFILVFLWISSPLTAHFIGRCAIDRAQEKDKKGCDFDDL